VNTSRGSNWRIGILLIAVLPVILLDMLLFTPCRCWYGAWVFYQGVAALVVQSLIALRFAAAWVLKEHNHGWKYYVALWIGSPFLVAVVFAAAKLALPADLRVHP
jgi:hypothetical protein